MLKPRPIRYVFPGNPSNKSVGPFWICRKYKNRSDSKGDSILAATDPRDLVDCFEGVGQVEGLVGDGGEVLGGEVQGMADDDGSSYDGSGSESSVGGESSCVEGNGGSANCVGNGGGHGC